MLKRLVVLLVSLCFALPTGSAIAGAGSSNIQMPENISVSPEAMKRITETVRQQSAASKMHRMVNTAKPGPSNDLIDMIGLNPDRSKLERLSMFIDSAGRIRIELTVDKSAATLKSDIEELGAEVTLNKIDQGKMVIAVPMDRWAEIIPAMDALTSIQRMRPVLSGILQTGAVNSEGDKALGADKARKLLGVDGKGARVCVISDGLAGAAEAAAQGELPVNAEGAPAIETCQLNEKKGAEGTAMLEIIHDLAPGAELGFCPAFGNGQTGFAAAIDWLAKDAFDGKGCDIIVDDAALLDEPYFQDGPIAQAVNRATWSGVSYFVSAGNSALNHYEADYVDTAPSGSSDLHDFGLAAGKESSIAWLGVVGAQSSVGILAQWSEAFGRAASDYNLLVFDINGKLAGTDGSVFAAGTALQGVTTQDGDDDPLELAAVFNTTDQNQYFLIVVSKIKGKEHMLEINFNGGNFIVDPEFNVPEGSIWGHAAARFAIAVGATGATVNMDDTPNPKHDIIEPFSSQGPSRIFFSPKGRSRKHDRRKPDITATDGVSVSGVGGFGSPFFGTSASAPHAAAVAALLIDAADRDLPPWAVRLILKFSAADRGKKGPDPVWGRGLVDSLKAVGLAKMLKKR